jgi:hypothetical protein
MQWLHDSSEINVDNLNNISCEAGRNFRNKQRKYPNDRIHTLAMNSKHKNTRVLYRGINEFKKSYQPRGNLVKHETGDLLADSHNILNIWKNYFSQLLNVHRVSDVRQIEIHTPEPLVPDPSPFEFEIAIARLKRYTLSGTDQIRGQLTQAGGEILCLRSINLLILFGVRKNCLISGRSPLHRGADKSSAFPISPTFILIILLSHLSLLFCTYLN